MPAAARNQPGVKNTPLRQQSQANLSAIVVEQTKRYRELALKERLQNLERMGKLVKREAVEKQWFKLTRQVRDALMNIPDRVAGICAAEKKQEKIREILEKEHRQVLEGLMPRV
jgi:phage terminase Nu1 subunit (DNA packaging protein)